MRIACGKLFQRGQIDANILETHMGKPEIGDFRHHRKAIGDRPVLVREHEDEIHRAAFDVALTNKKSCCIANIVLASFIRWRGKLHGLEDQIPLDLL